MERRVICFLLVQAFVWKIPAAHAQRSLQQYLHLTGPQYSTINAPTTTHNAATNPVCSDNQVTRPRPTTGLPSLAALSLPSLINTSPSLPSLINVPTDCQTKQPTQIAAQKSSNIDGNLLNNLAIALQLLLLGNLLTTTAEKSKETIPESPQNHLSQIGYNPSQDNCDLSQNSYSLTQNTYNPTQSLYNPPQNAYNPTQSTYNPTQNAYNPIQTSYNPTQNGYSESSNSQNQFYTSLPEQVIPSNLIGIPGIGNMDQPIKRTRSTMNLMSPYEVMAKSSYSDTPSYAPISRRDIQSPYSVIDSNLDFFPMSDLF